MIKLTDVEKIFDKNNTSTVAVNKVNLEINKGEIFGIIGYSGAGKSTLIRLINQLEKQTSGRIEISGSVINDLKDKDLRKQRQKIGMIFQHFNLLWSKTVLENIVLPLEIAGVNKETRKQRALELINLVGLDGKENAYPSELSGGQKQRVGIARALANDPEILLCDEATSALDPETTENILNLLRTINERLNITIVLITHEMNVIKKICHRLAVMENGVVVESGNVVNVFTNPKHKTTKRFVSELNNESKASEIFKEIKDYHLNGILLHLSFNQDTSDKPVLAEAIIKFNEPINIIQGDIGFSNYGQIGSLYVEVNKDKSNEIITYLEEHKVIVEVINK